MVINRKVIDNIIRLHNLGFSSKEIEELYVGLEQVIFHASLLGKAVGIDENNRKNKNNGVEKSSA